MNPAYGAPEPEPIYDQIMDLQQEQVVNPKEITHARNILLKTQVL